MAWRSVAQTPAPPTRTSTSVGAETSGIRPLDELERPVVRPHQRCLHRPTSCLGDLTARSSRPAATTTSSSSGSSRAARPGTISSSTSSSSSCSRDGLRRAAERPRQAGDVDPEARPRGVASLLLGEPVHDGVAAVREDHEQRAGAVVGCAPERLDRVQRRAVADERDDGPVGACHAHAGRGGKREAEAAHRRAQRAERLARRQAREELGAVRRGLLEDDRVRASRSATAANTCPARSGCAGRRRVGRRGTRERRRRPRVPRRDDARELGAHGPGGASTARSAVLRCTSAASWLTTTTRRPGLHERPRHEGVLPERRRTDGKHDVVRRERLAKARPVGGQVAGEQRVILRESRAAAERLLPDRAGEPLGERDDRRPGFVVVDPRAADERGPLRAVDELRRARRQGPASAARARTTRRGAARSSGGAASGPSRPSARSRAPARVRSPPRGRHARSTPGTLCARSGLVGPHGVVAGKPLQPAGRGTAPRRCGGGPAGPTTTTSGTRLTRAVASALTALPSPGVVCRIASAGSPRPIAKPVAIPTTELSWSPSTNRRSAGRSASSSISVEPGLAKSVVRPCSRRTSNAASRTVGSTTATLLELI